MLTGVVACPSIMFGTLPDDDVIAAAVDIVLRSGRSKSRRSASPSSPQVPVPCLMVADSSSLNQPSMN